MVAPGIGIITADGTLLTYRRATDACTMYGRRHCSFMSFLGDSILHSQSELEGKKEEVLDDAVSDTNFCSTRQCSLTIETYRPARPQLISSDS